MTAATPWRAIIPSDIVLLIAAVLIGGTLAGVLAATPLLFVTTPLVASALAAAAAYEHYYRTPEWQRVALETLARYPNGQARELLEDVLRRAAIAPAAAHAGPLVRAASEAARQLAALEIHIAAFEAQQETALPHPPRWRDAFERCQRGRDLLTQRLQEAGAALSRWQAAQGAGESLGELAKELTDESRYQQEAAHEVEALLA
jgi:hypothetical protein